MEYKHSHYLSNHRHLVPPSTNAQCACARAAHHTCISMTTRVLAASSHTRVNYTQSHGGNLSIPLTVIDTLFD